MDFEQLFDWIPGNGWLSKGEASLLYRYIPLNADEMCALEVGCYKGRSTVLFSHFFKTVYAVDPMGGFDSTDPTGEKTMEEFTKNLVSRDIKNVVHFRQRIEEWTYRPEYNIGFAYLDGDHTYQGTSNQIKVAQTAKAKVIAIHDVNDDGMGGEIKRAALDYLGPWNERVERLAVWVL